jgi:Fic family protein
MKNTKTLKDYYKEIIAMAESQGNTEIVDFCNGRIAQIENKAINKGETAKQKENEKIKDVMLAKFQDLGGKMVTVTELLQDTEINELVGGSNQKATALLTALKKAELIVNIKEGKKSYYKLA